MDNLHGNIPTTFPELQKRPSFFVENGKYYEQVRETFHFNEGSVRYVEFVQWIEKPFPTWISKQ